MDRRSNAPFLAAALAERLSKEFLRSLLGWVHSGFSVHGRPTAPTEDVQGVERLARCLTRGPLPPDVVAKLRGAGGQLTKSAFPGAAFGSGA